MSDYQPPGERKLPRHRWRRFWAHYDFNRQTGSGVLRSLMVARFWSGF